MAGKISTPRIKNVTPRIDGLFYRSQNRTRTILPLEGAAAFSEKATPDFFARARKTPRSQPTQKLVELAHQQGYRYLRSKFLYYDLHLRYNAETLNTDICIPADVRAPPISGCVEGRVLIGHMQKKLGPPSQKTQQRPPKAKLFWFYSGSGQKGHLFWEWHFLFWEWPSTATATCHIGEAPTANQFAQVVSDFRSLIHSAFATAKISDIPTATQWTSPVIRKIHLLHSVDSS